MERCNWVWHSHTCVPYRYFWLHYREWIEGATRHLEISWLATVLVQAGDDGGLNEGSDIGDRGRWMNLKYILEVKLIEFGT